MQRIKAASKNAHRNSVDTHGYHEVKATQRFRGRCLREQTGNPSYLKIPLILIPGFCPVLSPECRWIFSVRSDPRIMVVYEKVSLCLFFKSGSGLPEKRGTGFALATIASKQ
jgi:hypothetical protein